jgi:hypothetical protein
MAIRIQHKRQFTNRSILIFGLFAKDKEKVSVTPADPAVRASLLWLLPFKPGSHATGFKFTQCLFFIWIGIYFWLFARSLCSFVGHSLLVLDESLQFNFWFLSRSPTHSNMDSNMGRKQVPWMIERWVSAAMVQNHLTELLCFCRHIQPLLWLLCTHTTF